MGCAYSLPNRLGARDPPPCAPVDLELMTLLLSCTSSHALSLRGPNKHPSLRQPVWGTEDYNKTNQGLQPLVPASSPKTAGMHSSSFPPVCLQWLSLIHLSSSSPFTSFSRLLCLSSQFPGSSEQPSPFLSCRSKLNFTRLSATHLSLLGFQL